MKRLVAVSVLCACLALAHDRSVRWPDLNGMIADKDVVVLLIDGKRVKGNSVSVDADSLVVQTPQGRQSIGRRDVREIRVKRKAGYKWRIIGTAIGAGAGTAIAVPITTETHNEGSGAYDAAAAGLIIGLAVAGFLCGWSADKGGDVIRILPD